MTAVPTFVAVIPVPKKLKLETLGVNKIDSSLTAIAPPETATVTDVPIAVAVTPVPVKSINLTSEAIKIPSSSTARVP